MTGLTFEVSATNRDVKVATQPLVSDTVRAVYSDGGQLAVELAKSGVVRYSDVKAIAS